MINPIDDKILVRLVPDQVEDETAVVSYLRARRGIVKAMGRACKRTSGFVSVGTTVIFRNNAGLPVTIDEQPHVLLVECEIYAWEDTTEGQSP